MSNNVPIVDISDLRAFEPSKRLEVARRLGHACEHIGFIVVTGHGVSSALVNEMFALSTEFFDLPETEKNMYVADLGGFRGYTPLASEALARTLELESSPDLYEAFTIGRMNVPDDAYHRRYKDSHFAPNIWPWRPERFTATATAYYQAMEQLANELMAAFALALNLDEAFFEDKFDRHISNMRFINYPEQLSMINGSQLRCGAHTDYGSLTIVCSSDADGGLQVKGANGEWSDVPRVPDAFVINIGDLLAEWTNDHWVSTMHRVANPYNPDQGGNRRQSIAFFHQPNYDAVIQCIPTCTSADNPPRYAPVLSGDHLTTKVSRQAV